MIICFAGHCYDIPVYEIPIHVVSPPGNDPYFLRDAVLVASFEAAAQNVQNEGLREALRAGIRGAVENLQSRAGDDVRIREGTTAD
jgi:hypothetical protein